MYCSVGRLESSRWVEVLPYLFEYLVELLLCSPLFVVCLRLYIGLGGELCVCVE